MSFAAHFLLPLVRGGPLRVGRPLGPRAHERLRLAAEALARGAGTDPRAVDQEAALAELARLRWRRAQSLSPAAKAPPLDEATLRLGIAAHNLLTLGHPRLAGRVGERQQARIAEMTLPIADLGPPGTEEEAVRRHSLLARLPEITRTEHTVDLWLGQQRFVGRVPPARVLALPRLRGVSTTSLRRLWFKEIGVPAAGRRLWIALHRASPLGEALDPLRLDPPLAWERIYPVLAFPSLCRIVAGRILELGLETAGSALVSALLRFAAAREVSEQRSVPTTIAFGVRFLAHCAWLNHLYGAPEDVGPASELAALLVAAQEVDARLVWPADVPADAALGRDFAARLLALRGAVLTRAPERYGAALALCRLGMGAG